MKKSKGIQNTEEGLEAGGCITAQMLSLRDKQGSGPVGLWGLHTRRVNTNPQRLQKKRE